MSNLWNKSSFYPWLLCAISPHGSSQLFFSFYVFFPAITNYHKLIGFKTTQIIYLQSCRFVVLYGSHSAKLSMSAKLCAFLEAPWENPFPCFFATNGFQRPFECSLTSEWLFSCIFEVAMLYFSDHSSLVISPSSASILTLRLHWAYLNNPRQSPLSRLLI